MKPVPVTILTGFLGAGKTTLLNYILKQNHGYKFAVIINEVGKIGIDGALVETQKDEMLELSNGCMCCTVRTDLIKGVQNLLKKGGFDYLLIETTGVAEPGPIAQTFLNIPQLQQYVRLDALITVVDCEQIVKQMAESETAREQVAMADYLLLNKTDLVSPEQAEEVAAKCRELNPHAQQFRTDHSQVALKSLLDIHAFDLDRKLEADPEFLDELKTRHHHDIVSFSFTFERPIIIEKFEPLVAELGEKEKVYRCKGFLWLQGNPRRAVFHGVNNRFTLMWDRLWEKEEKRTSQLVFIGRDIDEAKLRTRIEACLG